jgi:hypothetical protein
MTANGVLLPTSDPAKALLADLTGPATIEQLLGRAERGGTKRAKTVAVRIRHDVDLLEQLLAEHGEEAAARRKVDRLRARLEAAEAELRAKAAPERNIARLAGSNHPAPSVTTKTIRAWLIEEGHQVADRGRLTAAQIGLYEDAHKVGDTE